MRRGDRVRRIGGKRIGVIEDIYASKAGVKWEDMTSLMPAEYVSLDKLHVIEPYRASNPAQIYAPDIQDLEFITRMDPKTLSPMMEWDSSYRGDGEEKPTIEDSKDIYKFWKGMSEKEQEHLCVGNLNVRQQLLGWRIAHIGKLDAVDVDPVEVLKFAVFAPLTDSVIVLHNHPSGDPRPSEADIELTKALEEIADLHGKTLFDHVIIGRPSKVHPAYYSFRDAGKLMEANSEEDSD